MLQVVAPQAFVVAPDRVLMKHAALLRKRAANRRRSKTRDDMLAAAARIEEVALSYAELSMAFAAKVHELALLRQEA